MITREFDSLKIAEYMFMVESLAMDLMYLEGRRKLFRDSEGFSNTKRLTSSVFKNFGRYSLEINGGSAMTRDKSIRFRIFLKRDTFLTNKFTKSMSRERFYFKSKWLSTTAADLKHYSSIFLCGRPIYSQMLSCLQYDKEGKPNNMSIVSKSNTVLVPMMMLMDHRRGASTEGQYNRYLVHGMTSYACLRSDLVSGIFTNPVRTYLEAYIKKSQLDFVVWSLGRNAPSKMEKFRDYLYANPNYDRVWLRSFYDDMEIEMDVMMDLMYLGNLFNYNHGFQGHRAKAVFQKGWEQELASRKVRDSEPGKGNIGNTMDDLYKFYTEPELKHTFDRNVVLWMSMRANKEIYHSNNLQTRLNDLEILTATMNKALMSSRSFISGPKKCFTTSLAAEVMTDFSFRNFFNLCQDLNDNTIVGMVNYLDKVEAVFSTFPKPQIGGPREILIQCLWLRVCVKLLEAKLSAMCKAHPKEMLTKSRSRVKLQTSTVTSYINRARRINKAGKKVAMAATLNMDMSRWSPAFVMDAFAMFVSRIEFNVNIKSMILTVIRAFQSKFWYFPKSLQEKWKKKGIHMLEDDKVMRAGWARGCCTSSAACSTATWTTSRT
jgi:hypothetical protein